MLIEDVGRPADARGGHQPTEELLVRPRWGRLKRCPQLMHQISAVLASKRKVEGTLLHPPGNIGTGGPLPARPNDRRVDRVAIDSLPQ